MSVLTAPERAHRRARFGELVAAGIKPTVAARQLGIPKSTAHAWVPPSERPGQDRRDWVDARPLADWLRRIVAARFDSRSDAARALGVDEARLRRLMRAECGARVSVYAADRLFVAAGDPHMLTVLYPLDDEEA